MCSFLQLTTRIPRTSEKTTKQNFVGGWTSNSRARNTVIRSANFTTTIWKDELQELDMLNEQNNKKQQQMEIDFNKNL